MIIIIIIIIIIVTIFTTMSLGSFSNITHLKEKPIRIWQIKTACIKP